MPCCFEREIREQPAALARLLARGRPAAEAIAAAARSFAPAFVVTAARGSSDNAARYAKYLFGAHNRLVVSLGAPSLITVYGRAPSLGRALVVGISQSGESPDIVALLAEGRRQGALTIAITNQPASPLGQAAAHVLALDAGPERAVAASKSYSAQLLALAMLSAALEEDPGRWAELAAVPDAVAATLNALTGGGALAAAVHSLRDVDRLVVLGRGFNFATAFEIALKLKETALLMADPYATPDLFHGPLALVEPGFPILAVAPGGAGTADMRRTLDALAAHGADLLAISDQPDLLAHPGVGMSLPFAGGLPEWLSPIPAIVPGQLLALALTEARGFDPDTPRSLSKVTHTH